MQDSLYQLQFAGAAPAWNIIGSLVRAREQCTQAESCADDPPDPVQPELATALRTLRGGIGGSVPDSLGNRRLSCTGFINPVINSDFADPSQPITGEDGLLYAYSTNSMGFNIQV